MPTARGSGLAITAPGIAAAPEGTRPARSRGPARTARDPTTGYRLAGQSTASQAAPDPPTGMLWPAGPVIIDAVPDGAFCAVRWPIACTPAGALFTLDVGCTAR